MKRKWFVYNFVGNFFPLTPLCDAISRQKSLLLFFISQFVLNFHFWLEKLTLARNHLRQAHTTLWAYFCESFEWKFSAWQWGKCVTAVFFSSTYIWSVCRWHSKFSRCRSWWSGSWCGNRRRRWSASLNRLRYADCFSLQLFGSVGGSHLLFVGEIAGAFVETFVGNGRGHIRCRRRRRQIIRNIYMLETAGAQFTVSRRHW